VSLAGKRGPSITPTQLSIGLVASRNPAPVGGIEMRKRHGE
jgi:hypothetical protein